MRTLIATLIAAISFTMVSCTMSNDIDEYAPQSNQSNATRSTVMSPDSAYVRIGMYNNVGGYNIHIENMRIQSELAADMLPTFGDNICHTQSLPSNILSAAFDQADGHYNTIAPTGQYADIQVVFDVVLSGVDGVDESITVKDVTYTIQASQAMFHGGKNYDYIIALNDEMIGLSAIQFSASVSDMTEVTYEIDL